MSASHITSRGRQGFLTMELGLLTILTAIVVTVGAISFPAVGEPAKVARQSLESRQEKALSLIFETAGLEAVNTTGAAANQF